MNSWRKGRNGRGGTWGTETGGSKCVWSRTRRGGRRRRKEREYRGYNTSPRLTIPISIRPSIHAARLSRKEKRKKREREKITLATLRQTRVDPRRVSLGTRAPLAMSGSDSPTFFHGQPWSSWIERIGRDKPLSKCAQSAESPDAASPPPPTQEARR